MAWETCALTVLRYYCSFILAYSCAHRPIAIENVVLDTHSLSRLLALAFSTICISVRMYMCVSLCVCVCVCVFAWQLSDSHCQQLWYSPTVDLASIGRCQRRHIELYRRIGSFQSICLVQLLHDVFHFPNAYQINICCCWKKNTLLWNVWYIL